MNISTWNSIKFDTLTNEGPRRALILNNPLCTTKALEIVLFLLKMIRLTQSDFSLRPSAYSAISAVVTFVLTFLCAL